jgi:hypothetical protein
MCVRGSAPSVSSRAACKCCDDVLLTKSGATCMYRRLPEQVS